MVSELKLEGETKVNGRSNQGIAPKGLEAKRNGEMDGKKGGSGGRDHNTLGFTLPGKKQSQYETTLTLQSYQTTWSIRTLLPCHTLGPFGF